MEAGFIMASGRRQNGEKTYDKSLRNASGDAVSRMPAGTAAASNPPSPFKRAALNTQNPKWKWRWGSTLSPFYAKLNHQAQVRRRKDDAGLKPPES